MKHYLNFQFLSVLAFAVAGLSSNAVFADTYPSKPIKLVVASGAGGSTDTAARIMGINIQDHLGQPIIIVNKKGASGSIGINFGLKAKPDGYLLMEGMIGGHVLHPAMNLSAGYTPADYTPIAMTQMNPNVLLVSPSSPYQSLQDLLDAIAENPGELKFSHAGAGSIHYFGIHLLLKTAGLDKDSAVAIPYKGGKKSMAGLLRGEADFHQTNLVSAIDFIEAGKVRALAVTTSERLKAFPDVPTFAEQGFPGVDIFGWRGVIGPKGLPKEIIDTWAQAIADTMEMKGWKKMVKAVGDMPRFMGPEEFTKHIDQDFKRYRQMATDLGILVE